MSSKWISDYVDKADFTGLFVEELGWERPARGGRKMRVELDGEKLELREAASYRGIGIWTCPTVPSGQVQRTVDKALRKESAERVVIFHDANRQVWRWPQTRDAAGAGTPRLVAHEHVVGRPNEALRQRLQFVEVGLNEDDITVLEVVRRLRRAFDSDKVTKSFYSKFAQQHRDLTAAIKGIAVSDKATKPELRWYGSILLNRLMFIYFMQRKGFLDGDVDYLRNRLEKIRKLKRPGSFYEFYKDFLIPLFHEGLGADQENRIISDPAIEALIGDIPYINGGIFSKHPLEEANDIRVPDKAFAQIFDFFDQWQWHLDDRPSGNPNEINPDVLGYIFEQFVNNREEVAKGNKAAATNADKGAYYTKEDVTGYMTVNTLVPVFLERLLQRIRVNVWRLVTLDPDRYIWSSVKHGCELPLPVEIQAEASSWPRPTWDNLDVPSELGLPAESWWEVVDRRKHVERLTEGARAGEINSIDLCITNNLDIETLAVDILDSLDTPEDVVVAWEVLTDLRVIDPTCGSGAFLFAALNILHRLYTTTFEVASSHARTTNDKDLEGIVNSASEHPNQDYFLLKHAALNNLYGVDLMPEAVEIARLRLFLKLIAQIESRKDVEPLPDLEFNIRPGNILVGALSGADISRRVDMENQDLLDFIENTAAVVADAYREFSTTQERGDHLLMLRAKVSLSEASTLARDHLDDWWFNSQRTFKNLEHYRNEVRPFHWLVEFPEIMQRGGFDVVVGNPPYVKPKDVAYEISGFKTDRCPDIYAPCLERSAQITRDGGRLAMIVPLSLSATDDFKECREVLGTRFGTSWSSTFGKRPSSLFAGVQVRCTIFLGSMGTRGHHTSTHQLWRSDRRASLFENLRFAVLPKKLADTRWFKVGNSDLIDLLVRLSGEEPLSNWTSKFGTWAMWWKPVATYWLPVSFDPAPTFDLSGKVSVEANLHNVTFTSESVRDLATACLSGKLGYLWWSANGDDLNVPKWIVEGFRMPIGMEKSDNPSLAVLAKELRQAIGSDLVWNLNAGKWVGNFDLRLQTEITDRIDLELLRAVGFEHAVESLHVWYHQVMQATGEATGSYRGPRPPLSE